MTTAERDRQRQRADGGAPPGSTTERAAIERTLAGLPLLSDLTAAERKRLAGRCSLRRHGRGDVLWHAGDRGEELVVVVSGGLDVWGGAAGTGSVPVARLGPGEVVGELALLLDEPRSASVTCARAAEVVSVPKAAFLDVVGANPAVLGRLTDTISRRAMALARGERAPRPTTVVGVVAKGSARGATLVSRAATAVASAMVTAVRVEVAADDELGEPLAARIEALVTAPDAERPRLVVLDLPRGALAAAAATCDTVVVVTDGTSGTTADDPALVGAHRVHTVVNLHPRRDADAGPVNSCDPFVLPHEPGLRGLDVEAATSWILDHPDRPIARTLGRLGRKLLGVSVGLALGGGAAFGIAHVGILQALEDAGLPVDLVAGTSMGSIIAIGHAGGLSGDDMAAIADRIGNVRTTMSVLDPTLSGAGLLNGRRLVSIFSPLLRQQTFDELVLPCRVVAMDVETGERVDIGSGRLDQAFRASCSIPLVFTPVKDGVRTLVDGGMIDPVPADVAREMGADIVVGVNVVPKLERGVTTALSRTFKSLSRFNPLARFGGGRDLPDLVDVLMNSLQVVEYELGDYKQQHADVRVDVPLAEFTWIEFYRATEIVERGRAAGSVAVKGLRAELARRLSP